MSSTLTSPGAGGACAILLIWHLELAYGISATNSQAAAIASLFSIIFGFSSEIAIGIKNLVLSKIQAAAREPT
jgi:hypothetical protein